jgi:hypothetical protein
MQKLLRIILTFLIAAIFSFGAQAQETGGAKGKVRNSNGDGVSGVQISVRQKERELKTTTTDSKGDFIVDGLKPGYYNFVFDKSGFALSTLYNVEIKKKSIRDLGPKLILAVDRGTLVIINGSVFFRDGTSIAGAKVEIARLNSDGSARKVGSGYTSESGEFTFRFPEGAARFRVTAFAKGQSASKEIAVDSAAVYRLAIMLEIERPKQN